ncbi:MAG TPA: hypothetical protein ENK06_01470, partial [Gammaproteobacteria bacterium]|nr:hypothetical protein [Gammaproteobacteria bacterium]
MSYSWLTKARLEVRKIWAVIQKNKYDKIAAELTDVLLQNWSSAEKEAIEDVIRAIRGPEKFQPSQLNNMLANLGAILGSKFTNNVAAPLLEVHTNSYVQGMQDIIKIQPTFKLIDTKAIDSLQRHNIFWISDFWDSKLGTQVADLGKQVLEQGLSREKAGELFEAAFADRFSNYSTKYWEGFSNHVVTRSRELGAVEGYIRAGVKEIEIHAIMDRHTTRICRSMNGRIIQVSEAIKLRDELIAAEDPRSVKKIAPWLKPEQIEPKPSKKLPSGMSLPPYHFNCRTRTTIRTKVAEKNVVNDMQFGKKTNNAAKEKLKGYNGSEWSNWLQTIRTRKKMRYRAKDLKTDFLKHGKSLGFISTDTYIIGARKVIHDSKRILVQDYKGSKQFLFFGENGFVVVDEEMDIRGYFEHVKPGSIDKAFKNLRKSRL